VPAKQSSFASAYRAADIERGIFHLVSADPHLAAEILANA